MADKAAFRTLFENDYTDCTAILEELVKPVFGEKVKERNKDLQADTQDKNIISGIKIFADIGGVFPINFVDVTIKSKVKIRYNKVTVQRCVRKITDSLQSALIFFHYEDDANRNWRITFVNIGESAKQATNPKRYTYLCGKDCSCRTAAERFEILKNEIRSGQKNLKELMINAFSVEALTKEFYSELFAWYEWAVTLAKYPVGEDRNVELVGYEKDEKLISTHIIRLVTRLIFVWFIKQKKLVPDELFDAAALSEVLQDFDAKNANSYDSGIYYNAVLQNLFFATLNSQIEERDFADKGEDYSQHFGIKTLFRDGKKCSYFKVSHKEFLRMFSSIPYLNGGLFECLDHFDENDTEHNHQIYVDGFSAEDDRKAFVPNVLFFDEERGIIPLLKMYNFTVEENTPSDVTVALDPELLGKVFENLLGVYNPETQESARKDSGSFYTPREIVDYMVNESIKSYLLEDSDFTADEIDAVMKLNQQELNIELDKAKKIIEKLYDIKVFDPACGSGAFPMGVLNKLELIILNLSEYCLGKIQNMADLKNSENMTIKKGDIIAYTPDDKFNIQCKYLGNCEFEVLRNSKAIIPKIKVDDMTLLVKSVIEEYNHDQKNKKTVANIFSQGHLNGNTSFINIQQKQKLSRIIDDEQNIIWEYKTYNTKNKKAGNQTDTFYNIIASSKTTDKNHYNLKLALIQNCIYGCDIQNIAIQITKLRFFISLICEQEKTDGAENFGINPLPNLETKIVCANSLIGLNVKENGLFHTEEIDKLENELLKIRSSHVIPKTVKQKYELRKEDRKLAKQLASLIKEMCDIGNEKAKQLADYNPYDQNAQNDFFDAGWMFGITDGFDIVIGNPPYVGEGENSSAFIGFKETSPYYMGKMNLWYGFACHGIDLLKKSGILCFIATNNWTTAAGGKKLRNKIMEDTKILKLLDFNSYMIFDSASIQTMIMIFQKNTQIDNYNFDCRKLTKESAQKEDMITFLSKSLKEADYLEPKIKREKYMNKNFVFSAGLKDEILEKMTENAEYLNDDDATNGIHPHYDFVNNKINRTYPFTTLGAGIFGLSENEKNDLKLSKEELKFIKPYFTTEQVHRYYTEPKNNLWIIYTTSDFKNPHSMDKYPKLKRHLDFYKDVISSDNKPYGLHRAREERFFKNEKIIVQRKCVGQQSFSYSNFDCYVSATFYVIQTSRFNLKFLTGLLNSKAVTFWLKNRGKMQGENFQVDKEPLMGIPIPQATKEQQAEIISLVDKILTAKKDSSTTLGMTGKTTDTSELEREIDKLVYKLYGLTEEEIAIVEGKGN